jgi:hypothetical protein
MPVNDSGDVWTDMQLQNTNENMVVSQIKYLHLSFITIEPL